MASIHDVPNDVLLEIFWMLAWTWIVKPTGRTRGWISLVHICKRWRTLGLETPQFWSRVDIVYPSWVETRCSSITPLHFFSSKPVPRDKRREMGVVLMCSSMDRVRSIDLYLAIGAMNGTIEGFVNKPAPALEDLDLSARSAPPSDYTTLREKIFAHHTPKLRRLRLRYINMSLKPQMCGSLRHLELCGDLRQLRRLRPNSHSDDFLEVLRAAPRLVTLRLRRDGPFIKYLDPLEVRRQPVELPHLELIYVRGDTIATAALLAGISTPQLNYADIDLYQDLAVHEVYNTVPLTAAFWSPKAWADPSSVHLNRSTLGGAEVVAFFPARTPRGKRRKLRVAFTPPQKPPSRIPPFGPQVITEPEYIAEETASKVLTHMIHVLPVSTLPTLTVSGGATHLPKDFWDEVDSYIPSLTSLRICNTAAYDMLRLVPQGRFSKLEKLIMKDIKDGLSWEWVKEKVQERTSGKSLNVVFNNMEASYGPVS